MSAVEARQSAKPRGGENGGQEAPDGSQHTGRAVAHQIEPEVKALRNQMTRVAMKMMVKAFNEVLGLFPHMQRHIFSRRQAIGRQFHNKKGTGSPRNSVF